MKKYFKYLFIILAFFPKIIFATEIPYDDAVKAVQEVIKAYYFRGSAIQYNSSKATYGFDSPEEATSQDTQYKVCSAYSYSVYDQGFGIKDIGKSTSEISTYAQDNMNNDDVILYYDEETHYYVQDGIAQDGILDLDNLVKLIKPGDILSRSHCIMAYDVFDRDNDGTIDDVLIIHSTRNKSTIASRISRSNNGLSYDAFAPTKTNGILDIDTEGSLRAEWLTESTWFVKKVDEITTTTYNNDLVILRPFHEDANHNAVFSHTYDEEQYKKSKLRTKYPSLYIEKTVDVGDNNNVGVGDILTYTIKVTNKSNTTYSSAFAIKEMIDDNLIYIKDNGEEIENKGSVTWYTDANWLTAGKSRIFTYKAKVKSLSTEPIEAKGMFYKKDTPSIYIETGTVSNPIVAKDFNETNTYESCYDSYKNTKTGLGLIDAIYKCVGGTNIDFNNFNFENFIYKNTNIRHTQEDAATIDPQDNNHSKIYSSILNNYWSVLIQSTHTSELGKYIFPIWSKIYPVENISFGKGSSYRARTIKPEDFKEGDILIYSITSNDQTAEDGLYAYIYIDGKFVGKNYPGDSNERNEFTAAYYTNISKLYVNGSRIDSIVDRDRDYINYQTLFDKDYYVILRPSITNIIFENTGNNYKIDKKNRVLYGIPINATSTNIINSISTNGSVNISTTTSNFATGDTINTTIGLENLEYKISIIGDVNGDGNINYNDAKRIGNYIVDNTTITEKERIYAADYDNNDEIRINDIIKLLKENN